MEGFHKFLALSGWNGTVQVEVFDAGFVQCLSNQSKEGCKLTEYQSTMLVFFQLANQLQKHTDLGGRNCQMFVDKFRTAGSLAELCQRH